MSERYRLRKIVTPEHEREIYLRGGEAHRKLVGWLPAGSETKKAPAVERVLNAKKLPLGGFVTDTHTGEVVFLTSPELEKTR